MSVKLMSLVWDVAMPAVQKIVAMDLADRAGDLASDGISERVEARPSGTIEYRLDVEWLESLPRVAGGETGGCICRTSLDACGTPDHP